MSYQPNQPNNSSNYDPNDPFAPLPQPNNSNTGGNPPPYMPPPQYGQQKKGPNTLLMILLGVVIGMLCVCGGCIAIFGSQVAAVLNNPTFQAGISTIQSGVGTGVALMQVPDRLPSDSNRKGTITAGQSQSGSLSAFDSDVWKYEGKNGENITVTVSGTQKGIKQIGIYDADGQLLQKTKLNNSSSSSTSNSLSFTLPSAGTYNIFVTGISGSYTLEVASN